MNRESDFYNCFRSWKDGDGSIWDVLGHAEVTRQLVNRAKRFHFQVFCQTRDAEDLVQDLLTKACDDVLLEKLEIPDNILTPDDLFNWFFVLMQHYHFSTIRWWLAQKRNAKRDFYKLVEDFELPVWPDFEKEEILRRFGEFFDKLDFVDQWIIDLWLDRTSLRDMQDILKGHGVERSHTTIGKRLKRIFEEFAATLQVPSNPPPVEGGRDENRRIRIGGGH